ncbi:putative bifunctional DNA-(apurinic or apyrimidinic site) lyase/formamidopyrimidine-DNA glycosylase [Magnetofaba australis IT-1]|uniref:Formamidopyrimidine-DNA glycosylase n=1 Tax=Magnetofaba australis IT-1 TaxID=1434232 RepID=A0A1Y2K320_9PROT|nr:putative bifunctional DNA-(apurinic or apyrimidinic site) lyase/formamidopyrimidine-DNA glycosylase [Magnetofaba australis IT-1]
MRQPQLRWPIPVAALEGEAVGRATVDLTRRAKYLLWRLESGCMILHLGMSGSLRIIDPAEPPAAHDHVDIVLDSGRAVRLNDPRRFGALLWVAAGDDPHAHALLAALGPEPLDDVFTGAYLHARCAGRKSPIKNLIMAQENVVGVGNIYASEALFRARILPHRAAGRVSRAACDRLVAAIKQVLAEAIEQGGTTLRDFLQTDGKPGYFVQKLNVYGRDGAACPVCETPIRSRVIGQRNSFYCPRCQH